MKAIRAVHFLRPIERTILKDTALLSLPTTEVFC